MSEPLLNAEQVAEQLGVPKTWILEQARRDAVPHRRLGRYIRFSERDLAEILERSRRGPEA
jgi:excisionase family DNA binding protein